MKDSIEIRIWGFPLRLSILLFPAVLLLLFYIIRTKDYEFYLRLTQEDSFVEYMSAAIYLMSMAISISISICFLRQKKKLMFASYTFLACGMFFIFGEEISWGQRILNVSSPDFFLEHSSQQEINLHNLHPVQDVLHKMYILVGSYGSLLWISLGMKKMNSVINPYFIPKWYLASYFVPVLMFYFYHDYIMPDNNFLGLTFRDQEPAELILSMGFLLFILINRFRLFQDLGLPDPRHLSIKKYQQ
jgi:hypothetical protein